MDGIEMGRKSRLDTEAESLWRAISSDPPPPGLSGVRLLDEALKRSTPLAYDRIHSPHLRPSQITRPR
jgi:hypothetical protein